MTLKMEIKEEPMAFEDSTVEMMETTEVSPGHLKHSPSSSMITPSFSASQDTNSGIISTPSFIHGDRTPETTESSSTTFHLSSSSDVMIPTSADYLVSSPSAVVSPASSGQNLTSPERDEIRKNHKERDKSKTNFSIDEILKPSFGHKKLSNSAEDQESAFHQPLDMRMTSTPIEGSDGKHRTEQDKVLGDSLCHQYDDYSNHSYTSSNSSPSINGSDHCNSGNRFSIDYNKIFGNHNQIFGSINAGTNPNEFWNSLNKLHLPSIMSSPHNFSNHLTFGFDVNALRNQIFSDIKLSNYYFQQPQNMYSSFFSEQIHHLNNTDYGKHSKFENSFLRHDYEPKPIKPANVKTCNNFSTTCKTKDVHMNPSKPSYAGEAKTLADVKPRLGSNSTKELASKSNISSLPKSNSNGGNCNRNKSNNNVKGVDSGESSGVKDKKKDDKLAWPAWVYCTRYSDRPSSGPRYRKPRKKPKTDCDDKRPRTAFSSKQLQRLKYEFEASPYLSEARRKCLALELGLNESQVKIWFQNKRAKLKKCSGAKNVLAMKLMEEGLYNHSTIVVDDNDDNGNNKKDDK